MAKAKVASGEIVAVNEKSSSAKLEQAQKVTVGVDRNNEQILQLNQDQGVELVWVEGNFRRLPSEIVDKLTVKNLKNYLKTENAADAAAERAKISTVRVGNPLQNPIGGYSEFRERIRPRKGWHQCWANPGRDFTEKMQGPYKQVRERTKEDEKNDVEPGYENGEVLKRLDGDGKVEAIALECPQELFEQYLQWMSDKSSLAKKQVKSDFFGKVENINRELPRDKRIHAMDDDGEVQE